MSTNHKKTTKTQKNTTKVSQNNTGNDESFIDLVRKICEMIDVNYTDLVKETEERLDIWCTIGIKKPHGKYAIAGANAGREYGYKNRGNIEALNKINDFNWIKKQYDRL